MKPASTPVVVLENVTVTYPRRQVPVLDRVTLSLEAGEQVIILGPSGAGKSTLLNLMTGVIPHSVAARFTGRVLVAGQDTAHTGVAELSRTVGVLAQDPESAMCMPDVQREIALPLENHAVPPRQIEGLIDEVLEQVNGASLKDRSTRQLSGGQGQRVALAASLVVEPPVLLLDEPTSMLDAEGISSVRRSIDRAVHDRGPAVVLVEHRIDEYAGADGVAGLPGRAIVLDAEGALIADGPTRTVLKQSARQLVDAGCWTPLETELQAACGTEGGLASPIVREELLHWAEGQPTVPQPTQATDSVVLSARGLSITRAPIPARKRRREPAVISPQLEGIDLELRSGEIVALLGANGTGKTSLLLALAGLLQPLAGTISGDRPGLVFQNPEHQFVATTVREEVGHGLPALINGRPAQEKIDDLLAEHRLTHLAASNPFRLSGGEKRRLSVAAMLAHSRNVLLADEPGYGLDRKATISMMGAFRDAAADGQSILFSSHDLRSVASLAHRGIVIAEGTIIADGPIFDVLGDRDVLARAGIVLPPLLDWLLGLGKSPEQIRNILDALDREVAPAARMQVPS
ncbi:ABC transporter ATP-binding protein [Arthrobacter rhombi]|uniref:ABC transporter ATP-binding protein n=1 Tax=Arthrobacter rhombi TaxID=71253 RepID=UPI003FD6976D